MTEFAQNILALLGKSEAEIRPLLPEKHGGFSPRPASLHLLGRSAVLAGSEDGVPLLLVIADSRRRLPDGFEGEQTALADGGVLLRCGHSAANAAALRRHFPWCAPSAPPACALSAGVRLDGEAAERIGLFARNGVFPVLSGDGTAAVRAVFEIFSCDCRSGYAVDGGRAGTVSACEAALTGGATFITLSPSPAPAAPSAAADYAGKHFITEDRQAFFFNSETAGACVARFGTLADFAAKVRALPFGKRGAFGLGIALDGGPEPTCPAEHLFVIRELRRRNLEISILFLRWPEEPEAFASAFRQHVSIARTFGGYRLAVPFSRELPANGSGRCEMLHLAPDGEPIEQIQAHFQAAGLKER